MHRDKINYLDKNLNSISNRLDNIIEAVQHSITKASPAQTPLKDQAEIVVKSKDPTVMLDTKGKILYANQPFYDQLGLRSDEVKGIYLISLIEREYHSAFSNALKDPEKTGNTVVFKARNAYGYVSSVECELLPYINGKSSNIIAVLNDISSIKKLSAQMEELKEHYSNLTETIGEAIARIDEHFIIVFANSAVKRVFGYTREELQGKNLEILFPPEIFKRYTHDLQKLFYVDDEHRKDLGLEPTFEILGIHKQRGVSPMEISFGNSSQFRGRTLTCIIRDITQRKNTERRLRKLALHDKLTNLGNRDLFSTDMTEIFDQIEKYPSLKGALMFLDLDGFKQINDTLGHSAGDELLIETAKRLRDCLRETDSIYRFGGDEFVIALQKIEHKEDAATVADKILTTIHSPYKLKPKNEAVPPAIVTIGVSIGIALFPEHGNDIETIVQNADLAMYEAKDAGKNCYKFYHPDMVSKATNQLQLEQGIKHALSDQAFDVHYQPLIGSDGKIEGVEALLRWNDPDMGEISPSLFIPVAEEKGLIIPLGNWVMETAFRDIAELNSSGYETLYVSVNISPIQLEQKDFIETVGAIIKQTNINPANVKLEITETSIMRYPEESIHKLKQIKENHCGVTVLIDDFGTGYSSLSYMSKLPIDMIKIDISFVAKLFQDNNMQIVKTIMHLANSLELKTVAEGIETKEQLNYFRSNHCTAMQGFLFSKAVRKADLLKLLTKQKYFLDDDSDI